MTFFLNKIFKKNLGQKSLKTTGEWDEVYGLKTEEGAKLLWPITVTPSLPPLYTEYTEVMKREIILILKDEILWHIWMKC